MALKETGAETRAQRSRADILEAAAGCFKEKGFAATSIDDVARTLGATKGMIYHHYPSKTDLFFAVYQQAMEINFATLAPHVEGEASPIERLSSMAHAHAMTMMREQAYQRTVTQGVLMHQTGATTLAQRNTLRGLIEMRDRYETIFANAIDAAVRDAGVELADLAVATRLFLAVLNNTVHWYRPRSEPGSEDEQNEQNELARQQVTYALQGLGLTQQSTTGH